jgi:transposase-like protein
MPEQRRRFSPRFKAEAVQMLLESAWRGRPLGSGRSSATPGTRWVIETGRPIGEVACDLGIHDGTLGNRVKAYRRAHPEPDAPLSPVERARVKELEDEVERWFGLLTDKQLRRSVHRSIQALEKDIRTWIQQWNNDPKPFIWTKTADEILDRLASYLQRIPGAVH